MDYTITQKDLDYVAKIITKTYKLSSTDNIFDDLVSTGNEALLKAVRNFEPERGTKLNTLIYRYVTSACSNFLRKTYAKEFRQPRVPTTHIDKEYTVSNNLDTIINQEKVQYSIDIIREFSEKEVNIFTSWLRGDPHDMIRATYDVSSTEINRTCSKILKTIESCS